MDEIAFWSGREVAAAIRSKQVSSTELLETYLDRVAKLNPRINAVVTIDEEQARSWAREADTKTARGAELGPLHGLPMTVKDTFEVAGMRTTSGSPKYADHYPAENAIVVHRLRNAGAVIFGKTNMPAEGIDWQSFNDVFGCTNNPWDETRTPGGSSGGSAAALAAGLTSIEVGSDIAGSLRVPPHYCGVLGLKTSFGIVPSQGHIPGPPGSLSEIDLAVVGPMGRYADDLDLGLDILAGPTAQRAIGWRLQLPRARAASLGDYRVACWLDDPYCSVADDVREVMESAVGSLRAAHAHVTDTSGPVPLAEAHDLFAQLLLAQGGVIQSDEEFAALVAIANTVPTEREARSHHIASGITMRLREWHQLDEARQRVRQRWAEFFDSYDVLLCPVTPTAAIPHDHSPNTYSRTIIVNGVTRPYAEHMVWPSLASAALLPAAVAPIGRTRSGLPVGIQIIAPYLEDRTAVDFARRIEALVGRFEPPPGF